MAEYVLNYSGAQVAERLAREYSLSGGTTGTFALEGVTAAVGTGDDAEVLIITTASTGSAVTSAGTISHT